MKNNGQQTVIAVHAHPDDTEIFCAGTLFLLKKMNFNIVIVTMTNGELGSYERNSSETAALRFSEAEAAADYIGAEYKCLNRPDGFLFDSPAIRTDLIEILRSSCADIILTHRFDDYHPDHRATAEITEAAAILSSLPNIITESAPLPGTPLLYKTDTIQSKNRIGDKNLIPHFYINISEVMDHKIKMLSFHNSQIELMKKMHKIDDFSGEIKIRDRRHGNKAGVEFAEAFWQHCGGGFQTVPVIQEALKNYYIEVKI
ncbi:MAG: PIG-L family deacetylase [Spirochaetes bacterium]|nr:PIG-L family deacetylase [Spirochaetota bacterium]